MSRDESDRTSSPSASSRLLQAAFLGLLSAGMSACSSSSSSPPASTATAEITSTETVGVMTAEDFQAMCDARGGTVEVLAHCGGLATGPGFAYDVEAQTLSEHTCAGANTCGGWNCLIDG